MLGRMKRQSEIVEDKSKFANGIKDIWVRENYEGIKAAHNEILEFLHDKNFDFFSVQYLLTMTYMELLVNEYLKTHLEEIKKKLVAVMENNTPTQQVVPK